LADMLRDSYGPNNVITTDVRMPPSNFKGKKINK